ncbi:MAG: STAS domain-containing protein [Marmoricola sp.]
MSTFETNVQGDEMDSPILHVVGDLDLATAPLLLARAEEVMAASHYERFRLDLSAIRFIDSTGLGALIKIRNLLLEREGSLVITKTSPAVDRVLSLVGLSDLFSAEVAEEAAEPEA